MTYTTKQLQLVLRDTDATVFPTEELETYKGLYPDSLFRAAASAVRSLAIAYAASGKSVKTDDLAIDLRSRGKDLLDVAASFDKEADAGDLRGADDYFNIVGFSDMLY